MNDNVLCLSQRGFPRRWKLKGEEGKEKNERRARVKGTGERFERRKWKRNKYTCV